MPMATARNQPDDLLIQYAAEVNAEMARRGLSASPESDDGCNQDDDGERGHGGSLVA